MKMKHKRKNLIEVIVRRQTKGYAFLLENVEYWKKLEETEISIIKDFNSMNEIDFREKYKEYLW